MEKLRNLLDLYNPDSSKHEEMCELLLQVDKKNLPRFLESSLEELSESSDESRAKVALNVLAPAAGRINMQSIKRDLEDTAFKILQPEQHTLIKKLLNSKEADTKKPLMKFIYDFKTRLDEAGVNTLDVSGRMKQPYSLFKKLRKTGTISDIHDLLAVRVLVENEDQCYEVLDVINSAYDSVLPRFKDYIKRPKPNGYRSLHATVEFGKHTVEVQIRTQEMHDFAEGGAAAHWAYDQHKNTKGYMRGLAMVTSKRKEDFVFVFSPNGDPYRLPKGATALDFAFAIHTGVGLRTKQVKVNGSISTLDYQPLTGDQVEVITGKEAQPKQDWLRIVTSKKAKTRIRTWLREKNRDRYRDAGRDILKEELKSDIPQLDSDMLEDYGLLSADDLFVAIGAGYISPKAIKQRLFPPEPAVSAKTTTDSDSSKSKIAVAGMEGLQYRFAQCCDPSPSDKIAGYITRGLGITVHKQSCPEIAEEKERLIACHWL